MLLFFHPFYFDQFVRCVLLLLISEINSVSILVLQYLLHMQSNSFYLHSYEKGEYDKWLKDGAIKGFATNIVRLFDNFS